MNVASFDDNAIPTARLVATFVISNLRDEGALQQLNETAIVFNLLTGPLSRYVIAGTVKKAMIERWVMECVANSR